MLHHSRTFEEQRKRSRSADPSRRFRKTDIFFNADQKAEDLKLDSSEYKKAFAWPKNADGTDGEAFSKRLNPCSKTHAAGLTSRQCGASNKAHVIQNSNGSTSIVIEPPTIVDYAVSFPTTGSATNLATMINTITHEPIRPLTSMALTSDLNKSLSSNGSTQSKTNSHVNKSVTLANLNEYTNHVVNHQEPIREEQVKEEVKIKLVKDRNNNTSTIQQNGELDEELLLKKLSKLNTYESIYGKKAGANCLFNKEEIWDAKTIDKIPKKSEYKSKFKPFSTYVYVTGKGWFKPKKIKAKETETKPVEAEKTEKIIDTKISTPVSVKASTVHSIQLDQTHETLPQVEEIKDLPPSQPADEVDALIEEKGQPWFKEALERRIKASEFRYRSEYGNPILGRSSLEEVYKKASNNSWQSSNIPKFEQLQQMRSSNSAFLPYDQHKKKLQDTTDSKKKTTDAAAKAQTPSKSPKTKRATSVPARKKATSTPVSNTAAAKPTPQPAKVWIKPNKSKAEANQKDDSSAKETSANKVKRPQNNVNKTADSKTSQQTNGRASPPIIQDGPVRTTQIKTPEDLLVGIKSPPPQDWVDKLDNEPINWTNSANNPSSINSNATYLMNEFQPSTIRSDNLADLSGLKI